MVFDALRIRNEEILEDTLRLSNLIKQAPVPKELEDYKENVLLVCNGIQLILKRNLSAILLNRPEILEDILSNTKNAIQFFRLLSERFTLSILRVKPEDRLGLSILIWLHKLHPKTSATSLAIVDGTVAVFPLTPEIPFCPTLYTFPSLERRGLLFQPLLFHEFGHLLYAYHKPEMDALVGDLKRKIANILLPASQRNDQHSNIQSNRRQIIVDTWYRWIQELYCDAVGFTIGGPSFLFAFSTFLCTFSRSDFYRPREYLDWSSHPISWLRVKFLAKRACDAGFSEVGLAILQQWSEYAHTMGIREDYFGFYDISLEKAITQIIDDMIVETSPQPFDVKDISSDRWRPGDSSIKLLNLAWRIKNNDPQSYQQWESKRVKEILS